MKYKVIENFLDKDQCRLLINEAENYAKDSHIKFENQRLHLLSTSLSYMNLLEKSESWMQLHNLLNSQKFLNQLLESLELKNMDFTVTNFFSIKKPGKFLKKYKQLGNKQISTLRFIDSIYYHFFKIFRNFQRILKFRFSSNNYVELIYDYSKSSNGYKREIHRDSDSRTLVFLLYLNELSQNGIGGNLRLHKYNYSEKKIPSRPDIKDCTLIESITPKPGRLVTFSNSHDSLHDVEEMKNQIGHRHFLYGSFTLLGKKNPLIKKNLGSLETEFSIFE